MSEGEGKVSTEQFPLCEARFALPSIEEVLGREHLTKKKQGKRKFQSNQNL